MHFPILLQIQAVSVVLHVEAAGVDQLVELDGQDVRVAEDEDQDDGHCNWDHILHYEVWMPIDIEQIDPSHPTFKAVTVTYLGRWWSSLASS